MLWALSFLVICGLWGIIGFIGLYPKKVTPTGHEFVPAVMALGLGGSGFILFWFSLAGFNPSRQLILSMGIAGLGFLPYVRRRFKLWLTALPQPIRSEKNYPIEALIWLPLGTAAAVVLTHALGYGMYEWDAYMLWAFKAKVLATNACIDADYFHNRTLAMLHLNYPLMAPMLMAGLYNLIGSFDDVTVKIIFPLFYLILGGFIYSGLRRYLSHRQSLMLTALYLSLPRLVRWAGSGYVDVPLTAFYAGGLVYLLKWMETKEHRYLILTAIFVAFTSFTKNEGLALGGLITVTVIVFACTHDGKRGIIPCLMFLLTATLLLLPWMLFRSTLPRLDEDYPALLTVTHFIEQSSRLPFILQSFGKQFISLSSWNGLWLLVVGSAMLSYPRKLTTPEIVLWFLLGGQLFIYTVTYVISPFTPDGLVPVTIDRLLIQISPLAILLIGYHWSAIQMPAYLDQKK